MIMPPKSKPLLMDRSLWPTLVLLVIVFLVFENTNIDLSFQDGLYNFSTKTWLVDAKSSVPRMLFYDGPKIAIIITAVISTVLCLLRSKYRFRLIRRVIRRCDLIVLIATLAIAPSLIAVCKAKSNVFCPYQITRYHGVQPYVRVLETYPSDHCFRKKGRGFPAGHASGGFALLSLAGLATTNRGRAIGITIGLVTGSAMGFYQIAKGAHYLSHTVITALFCWLVFLLMRRIFLREKQRVIAHT